MGVTIHFEGKLKSPSDFNAVIDKAKDFAVLNNMDYLIIEEKNKKLSRVKDEKDWDYEGPVAGIRIQPSENTDPLWLEFDENYYIQDFCKTQFENITVHIKFIKFFRDIEVHFADLSISDEGEYWETQNRDLLQTHFDNCFYAMEKAVEENNLLSGPFKTEDGRIIDLMEE